MSATQIANSCRVFRVAFYWRRIYRQSIMSANKPLPGLWWALKCAWLYRDLMIVS